jgi:transglutaminase-like putative cysteine protease
VGRLRIVHRARYAFDDLVTGCSLRTCLEPRASYFHQLIIRPLPQTISTARDAFGNVRRNVAISAPFGTLDVTAISLVAAGVPACEADCPRVSSFSDASARVPLLDACAEHARTLLGDRPSCAALANLVESIRGRFRYDDAVTDVESSLPRFIASGGGVCQDFAHFAIGCLRSAGVAARYVSGYLATKARTSPHAWVAAHVEGRWLEIDPTVGRVGPHHIALATGRDYDDVAPIEGTLSLARRCRVTTSVLVEEAP